ncbi:DEAD/DEAH box helicase family protein [Sphingomonas abietis]|uniref:Helicase n=1 Tax=Sphingomonas abietis TaxID=3012344 RepID=A0ABY7NJR1_9SPHN|nr:helicase [Sphingomonas abietis]WBO21775.1 helicase [Sphingomonas abietis]
MSALPKPFQQATVAAATAALTGANPLRRFLVADEVGLGKTVVARDTLAALARKARKFTVYYISSGHKVADQNKVELLRSLDEDAAKKALSQVDRVGLIPFEKRREGKLRLYAFTPQTSFSGTKRLYGGKAVERAFIKMLLDELYPGLTRAFSPEFIEHGATSGWAGAVAEARENFAHASAAFKAAYGRALRQEFGKAARDAILQAANDSKIADGHTIGRMRKALAQASLDAATPDLVILDEFQCYRELLDAGADNPLARQLLEGKDGASPPPILLLSATPYRFYAERWETGAGTAPHVELFDLIAFLGGADVRSKAEAHFRRFGDLLHVIGRLPVDGRQPAIDEAQGIKQQLEVLLTPLMSRTERPAARETTEPPPKPVRIEPHDLDIYRHFAAAVPKNLRTTAIAYWLSVPLPAQALGDRYQITRGREFPATRSVPRLGVSTWFKPPKDAWGSAKLRALADIVSTEALALPWMRPSLPWWDPAGPWARIAEPQKILLFSRFKATPQSVAALVSLEVERSLVGKSTLPYKNAWKKRHLNPKPNQGPTLALFHPSPFLIRAVDPLDVRDGASIRQVRARARQQIIRSLPSSIVPEAPNKRDARRRKPAWAVLAAIERAQRQPHAREFAMVQKDWRWVAPKEAALQSLLTLRDEAEPITWISKWELDALVDMALGAPGNVAGRALYRHLPELFDYSGRHYRKLARFCWTKLRTYLDRPVFWAVLPGGDATAKYQRACIEGCLEAVLDEHFWLRKSKVGSTGLIDDLSGALSANVGTFGFKGPATKDKVRIRCHAAVPFGGTESETQRQDQGDDKLSPARSEEIRSAFNTPFWPYVLATTSVGQEGLDFHSWCDQLGHWDLCSSPVDLEQREGRVQRFGGLTVRRPLAAKLGEGALAQARRDLTSPWDAIAASANLAFKDDETGLTPWWTLPGAELKRHLFALPQSRDIDRFARLKTQRLLYRVALGQPDQEDLVELLTDNDPEAVRLLQGLSLNLSAFAHRKPTSQPT